MTTKTTPSPKATAKAATVAAEVLAAICELTGDYTISAPQVNLLLQLRLHGKIAQQDLQKYTHVEKSANSRNVAKLGAGEKPAIKAGPGYVTSDTDLHNRRMKIVQLTPLGLALIEEAASRAARFLDTP